MLRRFVQCVFATVLLVFSMSAQAQEPRLKNAGTADEKQLLQELVNEVRDLRSAVQRASVNAYRGQMIIERIKIQQPRVDDILRQLEENQSELNGIKQSRIQLIARVNDLETELGVKDQENADIRTQHENDVKELKKSLEQQIERETVLNDQRTKLTDRVQVEQRRLDDLNNELLIIESDFQKFTKDAGQKTPLPQT